MIKMSMSIKSDLNKFYIENGINYTVISSNINEILMDCITNNQADILNLFFEFITERKIQIDINNKNEYGMYPLLKAIQKNNIDMVESLIEYANANNAMLEMNEQDQWGNYPFLSAIDKNNIDIVKLLRNYAIEKETTLEINKKNINGWFPLLVAVTENEYKMVQLIINYSRKFKIPLKYNKKNKYGWYPLLMAVDKNNVDMIKLLMNKSAKSGVILNIQDKDNDGFYPLIKAVKNNNVEIVKSLLNYAISNDIVLEINEHKPMTLAINNNAIDIVELLIDYTYKTNLIIDINEWDIKDISEVKIEILKLLKKYGKQGNINIEYSKNSELLKEYNKLNDYVNTLKNLLIEEYNNEDNNVENFKEDFMEWEVEEFDKIDDGLIGIESPEFTICNHKWKIKLTSNKKLEQDNDYFEISLINKDIQNDNEYVSTKFILSFSHYRDSTRFKTFSSSLYCFTNTNTHDYYSGYQYKIYKKDYEEMINSLMEDNKIVVTIYIRVYTTNTKLEQYISNLKNLLINNDNEITGENYYEWAIDNWEGLIENWNSSPLFKIGGYEWKIEFEPKKDGFLNLFNRTIPFKLCISDSCAFKVNETICINGVFSIRHSNNYSFYKAKPLTNVQYFRENNKEFIFNDFIKRNDLMDSDKPLLEDNKIVIGIFIQVYKNNIEKYVDGLKKIMINENNDNSIEDFKDNYYEWEVEELDNLIKGLKEKDNTDFIHNQCKWEFGIISNNTLDKEDDYFEVNLKKVDVYNDDDYSCAEFIIAFRNYDENPQYTAFTSSLYCFTNTNLNINNNNGGYRIKIYKKDYENSIEPLISNNKVIIGIYIKTYHIPNKLNAYISELKNTINDNNYEIQGENYYEWPIEDWTRLDKNFNKSPLFEIGGYKWYIGMNPNKDNILFLKLYNVESLEKNEVVCGNYVFSIRNSYDFTCFKTKASDTIKYFCEKDKNDIFDQSINIDDLISVHEEFNSKPIIENNKAVIGIYLQVYKNDISKNYLKKLKSTLDIEDNEGNEDITEDYIEFEINDIINLIQNGGKIKSPIFLNGDHKWQIFIKSNRNLMKENVYFEIYLKKLNNKENSCYRTCTKFVLAFRNKTKYKEYPSSLYCFTDAIKDEDEYNGYKFRIYKNEYEERIKPLIENNKLMIGAFIRVYNNYNDLDQYITTLKNEINDDNYEMKEENFYEWPIEHWSKLSDDWNISSSFNVGGDDWCIKLIPNNGGYVFLKLYNYNFLTKNNDEPIYYKYVFSIRNYNDYSCYVIKPLKTFHQFTNNSFKIIFDQFINESDLFNTYSRIKPLIESDKTVISIYVQVYNIKDGVDLNSLTNYKPTLYTLSKQSMELEEDENVVKAIYNFNGNDQNELDLYMDESLKVVEWNVKEGWSYGYHIIGNNKIEGLFPSALVSKPMNNSDGDPTLIDIIKEKISKSINQQTSNNNSDLVISLYDFSGNTPEELSIQKGAYLRITDWNIKEGWSLGYNILDNNKKCGIFPTALVTGKIIDKKEQYMNNIKNLLTEYSIKNKERQEENDNNIVEDYFEWKIRNFEDFQNGTKKRDSIKFKACKNQWKLELVFDKKLEKNYDYFNVFLKNLNINQNDNYINAKIVLVFKKDDEHYKTYTSSIYCFSNTNNDNYSGGYQWNIYKNDYEKYIQPLIDNGEITIGIYLNIYLWKDKMDQYLTELKNLITDNDYDIKEECYYEWEIQDLKKIEKNYWISSPVFSIDGRLWMIKLYLNDKKFIFLKLFNMFLPKDRNTIYTNFVFSIRSGDTITNYKAYPTSSLQYLNIENSRPILDEIIKLNTENSNDKVIPFILKNNKITVGIYIRIYKNNIQKTFLNNLKDITFNPNDNDENIKEDYIEWKLDNFEQLLNEKRKNSHKFTAVGHKWKLIIDTNGQYKDKENYFKIILINKSIRRYYEQIYTHLIFSFKNYKDQSKFIPYSSSPYYFSNTNTGDDDNNGYQIKIYKQYYDNCIKSMIEDNKIIIGVYIRTFSIYNEFEQYINELKMIITDNNFEIKQENYYEWEIYDWIKLNNNHWNSSQEFHIGDYNWKIKIYPKKNDYIYFKLKCLSDLKENENTYIKYVISIRNTNDFSRYMTKQSKTLQCLNSDSNKIIFDQFIKKEDLLLTNEHINKPILENNKLVIGVLIQIYKGDAKLINLSRVSSYSDSFALSTVTRTISQQSSIEINIKDIAYVKYNFKGNNPDELDITEGDYLKVLEWNVKEGWSKGHEIGNCQKIGLFPTALVSVWNEVSTN